MIIDELIAILGYDVKGEGELDRFNRGLDRAQARAEKVANRINMMSVAVGTFLGNIATQAATRLSSIIGALPGDVLKVGQEFENLETVLATIEGSSTKAKEAMAWVQDFAAKTPYDLGQVSEAFVRMRAYGLDPMSGLLERVGDAAAGMGKSLMQGVEAVADAMTGENERLKEFGIKTKVEGDKITYNWNENGKEMSKTVRKNGPEIIAALTEIFGRFDGAMDKLSKTQAGILANLGDTWTSFLKTIGDKGYYEEVTRRLGGVKDTIDRWEKDGVLDRIAQKVSGFLVGGIDVAAHIGNQIWAVGKAAYYAADGIVELVSRVTGLNKAVSAGVVGAAILGSSKLGRGLMMALARRIPQIAALALADEIITGLNGGDSYIGKLEGGAEALEGVQKNFANLKSAADNLATSLRNVFGISIPTESFFANPGDFINRELVRFVREFAETLNDLANAIERVKGALPQIAATWAGLRDGSGIKAPGTGTPADYLNRLSGGRLLGFQSGKSDRVGSEPSPERFLQGYPAVSGKSDRVGSEPSPERFSQGYPAVSGMDELRTALQFMNANLAKMNNSNAAVATINDNKQDNRDQSVNPTITINQTVQQATQAPRAAADAVGSAVGQAAVRRSPRFEMGPAF